MQAKMTRLCAAAVVALIVAVLAPGAGADKPTRIPPGPIPDFTIPDSCAFPVLVHVDTNNETTKTFSDGRTQVTGALKVTLTNEANPSHVISLNISGPGTFTPLPDGGTNQKSVGPWLWFFAPGQLGPDGILIFTTGTVILVSNADGTPRSFTHEHGTTTDVCALLG